MIVKYPLVRSMLDDDTYKVSMGQVIFHHFPRARVTYTFKNRAGTPFPENFDVELKTQLNWLAALTMTSAEKDFLGTIPFLRPTYVEWLSNYRFDPNEVDITMMGNELRIGIRGYWYRTILWEVRLMALISELYFILTGAVLDAHVFADKTEAKTKLLSDNGCQWIDYGTRRRFSYDSQDLVVQNMAHRKGFLGTSNMHLAMKYGVKPKGTYAHECIMGLSAKYGVLGANEAWMKLWAEFYQGDLGIALTDTYTTEVFLRSFRGMLAKMYDGTRHDSNDPYVWADRQILHYSELGIDPATKTGVFSDNLKVAPPEVEKVGNSFNYVALSNTYRGKLKCIGGIGTYFTNDCNVVPLNMVIKLATVDFGDGPKNVVKISDEPGKYTGDPNAVEHALEEIGTI